MIILTLGFTDDILLVADSPEKLKRLLNVYVEWSKKNGICFNIDKCMVMTLNLTRSSKSFYLQMKKPSFLREYKYLGVIISMTNKPDYTAYLQYFKNGRKKGKLH